MPHGRKRYLQEALLKALTFSPLVGILGQRQTGKTTLMRAIVGSHYASMDDQELLEAASRSPKEFVTRDISPFGIDECQLVPPLFPALKLRVQEKPRPGQFVLTGSIRFTSRQAIRESLTGRLFSLELLPMMLSEARELPLRDLHALAHSSLPKMQEAVKSRLKQIKPADLEHYLRAGGLPGICFHRDEAIRKLKWNAHLDTLLERDIKLVFPTTLPAASIRKFLALLAQTQGRSVAVSDLSRQIRISMQTINKLIAALEALFLIRRIGALGDRKRAHFYLEDQGIASYLNPYEDPEQDALRMAFSQIHSQVRYLYPADGSLQHFEARGGARVPLVVTAEKKITGIIPVAGETADRSALFSASSFTKRHPSARVVILTQGTETVSLGKNILAAPLRGVI